MNESKEKKLAQELAQELARVQELAQGQGNIQVQELAHINFNINPSSFYIYSRVSSPKQYYDANGLDYQDLVCENYIKDIYKVNLLDVNYYCDVGSGYTNMNRLKNFNSLVKNINNNSVIIISEISRIGRNIHIVLSLLKKLIKKNCWIISVSEGLCFNKSKLMDKQFYQKVIDAEKESDLISIRTTNANKVIRINNGYIGGVPYGKKKVKVNGVPVLVDNPEEYKIINIIAKLYKENKNINEIVDFLDNNNIKKKKSAWTKYSVKNIIKKNNSFKTLIINFKIQDLIASINSRIQGL